MTNAVERPPRGSTLPSLDGLSPSEIDEKTFWQGPPPPFDHDAMVSTEANRWNIEGVPTIYLAGDIGLALVEGGRHLRRPDPGSDRAIWSAEVRANGVLDVRTLIRHGPDVADRMWVLDRERCNRLSEEVRRLDGVSGMIVPSAGSLDDLSRWNLVLYVDRLSAPLESLIREPRVVARLGFQAESS